MEENTITYLNGKRRIVSKRSRAIRESKELSIPSEFSKEYRELKKKISVGEDLRPYLSSKIRRTAYKDLLLNDWGLHHLHFRPGEATGPVLFVKFTDADAFVVQALRHGHGHPHVWVNEQRIRIVHSNWPELIARRKVAGSRGERLTEAVRKTIRDKHCNTVIEMPDGTRYLSPGGGLVGSGHCSQDILDCDIVFAKLSEWEQLATANESSFRTALKISSGDPLSIKLVIEEQGCWLYEPNRRVRFHLCLSQDALLTPAITRKTA